MHKAYQRYGGLVQFSPLTGDEAQCDDTCRQIDQLETEIGSMSAALFTAQELLWFNWFAAKTFFFPSQEQLGRQLAELRALKANLNSRSTDLPEDA